MAVLGIQLVISMILASMLARISPKHSFARWLLCSGLVRYLYPSDEELRKIASIPHKPTKNRRRDDKNKEDSFTIPKNLDFQLDTAPVTSMDILPLHFYTEFQWLIDFSLAGIVVYLATELYYILLQPKAEFNLSMMWGLLVLGFSVKIFFSLTAIYFHKDEAGERIMCIIFGFFFLVLSMGILIINEDTLEFGLQTAYFNFSSGATVFLKKQGIESAGPVSFLTFLIILAFVSAFIGAFLTFPGLRLAKMHADCLKYATDRPFFQFLLHMNIVAPLIASLMWLKPVTRDLLVQRGSRIMSDDTFDAMRLWYVIGFCLLRFCLVQPYLQAHLNSAFDKVKILRREAGRIKAIDLQKMIIQVFYYLCVVALQYLAPVVFLLFCVLMLKTLGDISLFGELFEKAAVLDPVNKQTSSEFSLALGNLREVFTPVSFKALFSYLTWWSCTCWFITSAFGMLYYSYFVSSLN